MLSITLPVLYFLMGVQPASAAHCFCTVTLSPGNIPMGTQAWPNYVQLTQQKKCNADCSKYLGTLTYGDVLAVLNNVDVQQCGGSFSVAASSKVGTSKNTSVAPRSIATPPCPQCDSRVETTTLQSGATDQFALPADPPATNSFLTQFLQGKAVRKFDEAGTNKLFGTSFDLGTGRTFCSASLELSVSRKADPLDWNDKVYVYLGPITSGNLVLAAYLWPSASLPSPRLMKVSMPASIMNSLSAGRYLSVIAQDDTALDYVKLVYTWK